MNLKKILVGLLVIYGVISGWMIGAPYIRNAMFGNDVDTIARTLSVDGTILQARNQLLEAVRINGIPAREENFTIVKDEQTRQVLVEVRYSVSVTTPLGLYTHVWNFKPSAQYGLQRLPTPGR
ncbi:MAG: hypothetical protein JSV00_04515 [bacterium]|nr:MAG: hypothetical protein JSV00_04515 [bacterium]